MIKKIRDKLYTLLRWGERITKTDVLYLAKGGSWLGLGQGITSLAGFLLSIAFANLLPKETYGEYRYLFSIVGVAGAFSLTGMELALSQAVARGFDGTLTHSFKTTFRWTFGTVAVLLGTAIYYFTQGNATLGWGLCIIAICMPLLKSFVLYSPFLVGKKDFSRRAKYGMLYDLIPAVVIAGVLFFTDSVIVLIATYSLSYTSVAAVLYWLTRRAYSSVGAIDETTKNFSLHLSAMNFIGTLTFQLDKILTFHYLGAAQLAVYSFAIGVPQNLRQFQKIITTLALPRFSAHTLVNVQKDIHRKALYLFLGMAAVTSAYILTAPFIFKFVFPDYVTSTLYSQVFALILLFAPGALYQQVLVAHGERKGLYIIQGVGAPIRIGGLFILIPLFGIWGIFVSLFLNETVRLVLAVYFLHNPSSQEPLSPEEESLSEISLSGE